MKNSKLVVFFTACFLFAGMQFATAQVKDKVEEVKITTEEVKTTTQKVKQEVKQEASKLNPADDKRVYKTKPIKAKKIDKVAKMKAINEKSKKVNGDAPIVKELDSDELEEENLEGDDLDDDDN